jgi:uncharacterized protein (TIGR02246 family)
MKNPAALYVAALLGFGLLALQCAPVDNRAADEVAVREADAAWSRVTEAGDLEGHLSYLLDDATILAPNQPMLSGKDAIREMMTGIFAMPGFSLKWQPTKAEAARSGDIAYSIGTYEFSFNGPDGAATTDRGKYSTVWKKQADGSWKVSIDMFNTDMPMPGAM